MWYEKIQKQWEENPLAVIGVGAIALTAAAKFLEALGSAQSRHAYAKQVKYRAKYGKHNR